MTPGPVEELNPPRRTLLGPGPSDVDPRVLRAMSAPILGYLDPEFIKIMDGVAQMLREVFATEDAFTLPISGTGSAGMEAALANLLEPGDVAVVVENGFFGLRLSEIASRQGAEVVTVPVQWGKPADPDAVEAVLKEQSKVKLLAAVHAETSTGVLQPLDNLSKLAHDHDALFLVDAVTSLGGSRVDFDDTDIDFAYSATQKCLGAPPGMSPVAVSARGLDAIKGRTVKARSWYLDLGLLLQYWAGGTRVYHHTAPMSMIYALREALRLVLQEGLDNRIARHRRNGRALRAGLTALGLELLVPEEYCTYQLTSVHVPEGVDDPRPAAPPAYRVRYRDWRRVGRVRGQDVAHRPHGRVVNVEQRAHPAVVAGGVVAPVRVRGGRGRRGGGRKPEPRVRVAAAQSVRFTLREPQGERMGQPLTRRIGSARRPRWPTAFPTW